jgi:hypothetical protein
MEFHDRLRAQAMAMGVRNVRIIHRCSPRPRLTGTVDGIDIVLGLPLRPKDLPRNFLNCMRDLRRMIRTIRDLAETSNRHPGSPA